MLNGNETESAPEVVIEYRVSKTSQSDVNKKFLVEHGHFWHEQTSTDLWQSAIKTATSTSPNDFEISKCSQTGTPQRSGYSDETDLSRSYSNLYCGLKRGLAVPSQFTEDHGCS